MKSTQKDTALNNSKIFIVLLLLFLTPFLGAQRASGYEIIGFGDSITKGTPYVDTRYGNGRRVGGYEPELENLLGAAGRPSVVYNWGIGGEHTVNGVMRIDDVIESYDHLDFVLIMEGTNDIGVVSMSSTMFNLLRMIKRCRERNVEPIIATLTPDTLNSDRKKDYIPRLYNPEIREMAATSGVILADQYNATIDHWSSLTYDGVHPNRSGYRVLARTWRDAILSGATGNRPEAHTLDADVTGNTSAILNGSVNPNNSATTYYFEYGPTTDYDHDTGVYDAGSGGSQISVSATVNKLTMNTTYHYRIVARNANGTAFGEDKTFSTSNSGNGSGADVNTMAATNVGADSARLNGSLLPNANPTRYYFEYGTNRSYGQSTPVKTVEYGSSELSVSEDIDGLTNNTTYHYRLVSERNGNSTPGNDVAFTTGPAGQNNGGSGSGCFISTIHF